MSERPPEGVAEGAAVGRPEALSPQAVESALADFRAWLHEAAAAAPPPPPDGEAIDLHTLLAQFTALRHEVHLQTRAARAQQEQGAEALRQLGEAVAALQQSQIAARLGEEQGRDEAVRPLLKALVDVHDALALAEREVRRVREALPPHPRPLPHEGGGEQISPPSPLVGEGGRGGRGDKPPFLARLFGFDRAIRGQQEVVARLRRELDEERSRRPALAAVLAGYTMSVQRVERALRQHGLEPIPAVGQPFDPEYMEALDVVTDSGRPPGEVVGEVRRGYLWRGRVFRFAQVRVAKS